MLQNRSTLEQELNKKMTEIILNNKIVTKVKNELLEKHNIKKGITQNILSGTMPISEVDLSLLCLITFQLYNETGDHLINPADYFTDKEIQIASRYEGEIEEELMKLPLDIENVIMLGSEDYLTKMTLQQLVKLYESGLLEYNFQTQRNPKLRKTKDKIVMSPNVNPKSVKTISEHILNNTFLPDAITLNVLSDGNDHIIYDGKQGRLTIESGEIDILDGFHRTQGMLKAFEINPDVEFSIGVHIKNYGLRKAQTYVAQVNTVNKVDKGHIQALRADRYADFVVKELQRDSDLKGKIVQSQRLTTGNTALVSYSVLSDAIHEIFKMDSKKEAMEVAEYLIRFFDYLIGSYPDEFKDNIDEVRKYSLINNNNMFIGYVALAKHFKDNEIKITSITQVVDSIDFNKENPMWMEIGVLENGKITNKAKRKIKELFLQISKDF